MKKHTQNILVGSLLGDGWLYPLAHRKQTSSYHTKCNDKSLGYLKWVRKQLEELNPSNLKSIKKYSQHYFYVSPRTDIGKLRKLFYPNEGKKVVPPNIKELLTEPISLAVWYQDDGTLDNRSKYHRNALIATHCFSFDDCTLLKDTLWENFGIKASVCKCQMRGKMYFRLYIFSESMDHFVEIIRPYIHKNYAYKIR
jgi:hypothetical protein